MTTSILNDIKHLLGLDPEDAQFDLDVVTHINSTIDTLTQLAVGPLDGFEITGPAETWDQFVGDRRLNTVRSYIYLCVKLLLDPNDPGPVIAARERQKEQMEFRINVMAETP